MHKTFKNEPMPHQQGDLLTQPDDVLRQRQKLAELIGTLLARQWWRAVPTENQEAGQHEPRRDQEI